MCHILLINLTKMRFLTKCKFGHLVKNDKLEKSLSRRLGLNQIKHIYFTLVKSRSRLAS
jgi:hypothetical protein